MMEKYLQLEAEHDKVKLAHGLVQQSMEYQTKEMLHRKVHMLVRRKDAVRVGELASED